MKVSISIIVPIYNICKYLPSCIDSILAQTYTDFELLLIDDGSSDGSAEICDSYSRLDCRIKVVHKSNGGVSSARNIGIDIAKGDWIAFIDGDDYVVPNYLESLLSASECNNVDLVCCNILFVNPDKTTSQYPFTKNGIFPAEYILEGFFTTEALKIQFYGPCNKIIRRTALNQVRFRNLALGEDLLFMFELLGKIENVSVIALIGYHYIKRPGSATTSGFNLKKIDYVKAAHWITMLAKEHNEMLYAKSLIWTLRHSIVTLRQIYMNKMESFCHDFVNDERKFLQQNKSLVVNQDLKRRIDYYLVLHFPKMYRILTLI
jgi:glycosyltransferase involved in cell wall biosynthesis